MLRRFEWSVVLFVLTPLTSCGSSSDKPATATTQGTPRPMVSIQKSDLVYEGAFRVPRSSQGASRFDYGGTALAYNPANNSLFLTGHDQQQMTAEISIPQIISSNEVGGLDTAQVLQTFRDPVEGRRNQVGGSSGGGTKIGGHLVYDDKLYVSAFAYYDASGSQSSSHFVRPLNLATTGQVQGPFKLGSSSARWLAGYMGHVPPEWQAAFGGPALTGLAGVSIAGAQSNGPAAAVFDPANVGGSNAAQLLLGYSLSQTLAHVYGYTETSTNPYWNNASEVRGVVFPNGTSSVLFFGMHGTGPYCYGSGTSCNDPVDKDQGNHSYPYEHYVWAYDANDLVAVKNGQRAPGSLRPYAVWSFETPFSGGENKIGGAAWDPQTRRIYLLGRSQDGNYPLVHVYRVTGGG